MENQIAQELNIANQVAKATIEKLFSSFRGSNCKRLVVITKDGQTVEGRFLVSSENRGNKIIKKYRGTNKLPANWQSIFMLNGSREYQLATKLGGEVVI